METKERYETGYPEPNEPSVIKNGWRPETTEAPRNGHPAPSAASGPEVGQQEWVEADRVVVHLILARKRGTPEHSVKIGEVNYLDANQRPIALFADAEDPERPWGAALEKFIAAAILQAGQQG